MGLPAPLLCFGLLFLLARRMGVDHRRAILAAAVGWGVLVTAITESLSLFHLLTPAFLLLAWAIAAVGVGAVVFAIPVRAERKPSGPLQAARPMIAERAIVIAIVLLSVAIALIGLISAPTNWDSMTYHLVRVMHWMQNRSVEHYPTGFLPQLYQGPWAEFAVLHLQLLTDSDRYAFAVQWVSMAFSLIGVSVLAGQLGAGLRGQALAVAFAFTIPSGVLQAYSTQNNLVVGAWLVCAAVALLSFRAAAWTAARPQIGAGCYAWAVAFGASVGLAVLTKGTGYLFAAPLCLWFALVAMRAAIWRGTAAVALAGAVVVCINVGHWSRNYRWCGSPLMPANQAYLFRTDALAPKLVASNLIRNIGLELVTPAPSMNAILSNGIVGLHKAIRVNVNDPRITFPGDVFSVPKLTIDEDSSGNLLHLLILISAGGGTMVTAMRGTTRHGRQPLILLGVVAIGFILFCAMVKWQPFHARLHLPLFVLGAPLVGIALELMRRDYIFDAVVWVLLAMAFLLVIVNPGHPLIGRRSIFRQTREAQYFAHRPGLYEPYRHAVDLLAARNCQSVGVSRGPVWEYPLWVMLKNRTGRWPSVVPTPPVEPLVPVSVPTPEDFCAVVLIPPRPGVEPPMPAFNGWAISSFGDGVKVMRPRRAAEIIGPAPTAK